MGWGWGGQGVFEDSGKKSVGVGVGVWWIKTVSCKIRDLHWALSKRAGVFGQ